MATPAPHLDGLLKQLRLSGISDTLDVRNKQAIHDKLAYTDFLALLLSDEIARRDANRFSWRLKRASLSGTKTLDSFDFSFNPKINHGQVADLATCRFIGEASNVLIVGPCGTGKTHIAQALGHHAVRQCHNVIFTTQSKLLASIQHARATGTHTKKLRALARIDILIIDDFAIKPITPPLDEDFHELINERYQQRSTIITSNLDFDEWPHAFTNRLLGAATNDRLQHDAYRLTLNGASYRRPRNTTTMKQQPEKTRNSR